MDYSNAGQIFRKDGAGGRLWRIKERGGEDLGD